MKKILILMPVLFLLALAFAYAADSENPFDYIVFDNGGVAVADSVWFSPQDDDALSTTIYETNGGDTGQYEDSKKKIGNLSLDITANSGANTNWHKYNFGAARTDFTCEVLWFDTVGDTSCIAEMQLQDASSANVDTLMPCYGITSGTKFVYNIAATNIASGLDRTGVSLIVYEHQPDSAAFFVNGTLLINDSTAADVKYIQFRTDNRGEYIIETQIDDFLCWNGTRADKPQTAAIDSAPPTITISSPANSTRTNVLPLNISVSISDDGVEDVYCTMNNQTDNFDSGVFAQDTDFNLTFTSTESEITQDILLNITCFDNTVPNNNSAVSILNISIDNILPVITISSPANNIVIDKFFNNFSYSSTCTDVVPLAFNATMINGSGFIVNSSQDNSPVGNTLTLIKTIDLTDISVGSYTLNFTCVDSHTHLDSKIDYVIKEVIDKRLYYRTASKNDINIQLISSTTPMCDFWNYPMKDREVFVYDFWNCGLPVIGVNDYIFTVKDTDNKLRYLKDSEYDGHFVTDDNFITFHLEKGGKYDIKKISGGYQVKITTSEHFLEFKNSIGGLNKEQKFLSLEIIETVFKGIDHFDFEIDEVILDSSSYMPVFNGSINFSTSKDIIFKGSGLAHKFSGGTSTINARLTYEDQILFDQSIVSVTGANDRVSFNFPIVNVTSILGINNFTLEFLEDGSGAVNISSLEIQADVMASNAIQDIAHNVKNDTFNYADVSFTNVFNISIIKPFNSSTLLNIHHTFGKTEIGTATPSCRFINNITGELTPTYTRFLSGITDTGSSGISYRSKQTTSGHEKWGLQCKSPDGAEIINIITTSLIDMRDAAGNIINGFQNESKTTISVGGSTTEILKIVDFTFRNTTRIDYTLTAVIQSTSGTHIPNIKFNSSALDENVCSDIAIRSLSNNNDIGTIKFTGHCNAAVDTITDLSIYSIIAIGESIDILNLSISGYEADNNAISTKNIPPIIAILEPDDNDIIGGINSIRWHVTDADNYISNVTIINSSDIVLVGINLSNEFGNISYNFTQLGAGLFDIRVVIKENDTAELFTSEDIVSIRSIISGININLTLPENGTIQAIGFTSFDFSQDTKPSNNCSLYIDNTINIINQTLHNISVGSNSFSPVTLDDGEHTWLVRCDNASLSGVSAEFILTIDSSLQNAASLLICPDNTAGIMVLGMFVLISLILIGMGFAFNVGIMGVFGALMLMITSWYLNPCISIFAYAVALFSFILIFVFISRGFFPSAGGFGGGK